MARPERRLIGMIPVFAHAKGDIVSQAFILCAKCRGVVSATAGPRSGTLCLACTRKLLADPDAAA